MSNQKRKQHRRGHLAVLAIALVGRFPLRVNRALATLIGKLLWLRQGEQCSNVITNLEVCFPAMPAAERKHLAYRAIIENARAMIELAWVWTRPEQAMQITQGNTPNFHQALHDGKPVLILAPHLGCWEVLNFWLSQQGPMHAMFMPSGVAELDSLIQQSRERLGSTLHPASARGVASLVRAVRDEHAITGILPDQVPHWKSAIYADFFGRPASTGTLACKLLKQTGAVAFFAFARRLPHARGYEIVMHDAKPELYDDDLPTAVNAMNHGIEQLIAEQPDQYLWTYRRFRRQPPGLERPYKLKRRPDKKAHRG